MTADLLTAIVSVCLSLAFSYIPGLRRRWEPLDREVKQGVMGILLVLVAASVFGLSCTDAFDWVECSQQGAIGLVALLIEALVANQSAYALTKPKK